MTTTDGRIFLSRRVMTRTTSKKFTATSITVSPCSWRGIRASGFVDVSSISGEVFKEGWVGRGMATGDLDNDGRVDAVVSTNGGLAHILHNETATGNHWLSLHLTGHKSNRDGIGAVVKLTTACGSQWATVTTSSSYLSASDPRVHFGLGKVDADAAIEIRWPSGIVQTLNTRTSRPGSASGRAGLLASLPRPVDDGCPIPGRVCESASEEPQKVITVSEQQCSEPSRCPDH